MVDAESLPPWIWPRAAYVHIPFCAHHCGYCDFAVVERQDDLIDLYIEALASELSFTLQEPQPIDTLFLGGGTPTHLSPNQLDRLLHALAHWLPLRANHEFTVEANPRTLTGEKITVLADHGVNRVSLGAQSFGRNALRILERDHDPGDVPVAVERIKQRIPNVSLDLIFGVPGQSLAEWLSDLGSALQLAPVHVSTYGLTYEKGTRLWKQRARGEITALDEESELAMYQAAMDTLATAGFEHYEISNFALPGRRCRHNEVYWANEAYFGFGMGAARYVQGRRELNTRNLATYLKRVLAGEPATFQSEILEPPERARETIAVQLRRMDGINREAFEVQTGFSLDAIAGPNITHYAELGLMEDNGVRVRLTRQGKCVADAIITSLL